MKNAIVLLALLLTALFTCGQTIQTIDDSSPLITYHGDWHTNPDARLFGSTQHFSSVAGSSAVFTFTGDYCEIVYYTEKKGGAFILIADGECQGLISCQSETLEVNKVQKLAFGGAAKHQVMLVAFGGGSCPLDAIKIGK